MPARSMSIHGIASRRAPSCRRPDRAACCRPCRRSRRRGMTSSASACPSRRCSTTMKPSSASACASPRAAEKLRLPTLPDLRPGIDVVDDRILLRRVEVRRPEQQAVEIGLAVARLHRDRHRRLPAGRRAAARCRPSRAGRSACRSRVAQHGHRRHVGPRVRCRRSTGRRARASTSWSASSGVSERRCLAVEADAVEVPEVRIPARLAARRR